jgi:hypothetical protein
VWPLFVGYQVSRLQGQDFLYTYFSQLEPTGSYVFFSPVYSDAERFFVFGTILSILILGSVGFVAYLRAKVLNKYLLAYVSFFGALFVIGSFTRNIDPTANSIWVRLWEPFFVPVAVFCGYVLIRPENPLAKLRINRRVVEIAGLIILLCLPVSYGLMIPREYLNYNFERERGVIVAMREGGLQVYQSTVWFSGHANSQSRAVADQPVYDFLSGYFRGNPVYSWDVYTKASNASQAAQEITRVDASYVFVDQLLAKYDESPTQLTYIGKIPRQNLVLLGVMGSRVYDNSMVQIIITRSF